MSIDLEVLEPELRRRWHLCDMAYRQAYPDGPDLRVICTYRTLTDQAELLRLSQRDPEHPVTGVGPGHSLHNYRPCYALDFGLFISSIYMAAKTQDEARIYRQVGHIALDHGLRWGITLPNGCIDLGHVQVPNYSWREAAAGTAPVWLPMPGSPA